MERRKNKMETWLNKNKETIIWIIGIFLMLALTLRGFGVI